MNNDNFLNATIYSIVAQVATIKLNDSLDNCLHKATIAGILKFKNKLIKAGDIVKVEQTIDGKYHIVDLLERKNTLIRPNVSNIDQLIIIQSAIQPNFNATLMNKFLINYEYYIDNIVIAISKTDLLSKMEFDNFQLIKKQYQQSGYKIYDINDRNEFNEIIINMKNKLVCLVGNSGVGKSTFINKINPNLLIKVQEISKTLNRGKHTTTISSIIEFEDYTIIDTPGFSSIDLNLSAQELAISWHDFRKYSLNCKFSNCLHNSEPSCEVKKQLEKNQILEFRYNDYLIFLKELMTKKKV